jgi:hypothetical protein
MDGYKYIYIYIYIYILCVCVVCVCVCVCRCQTLRKQRRRCAGAQCRLYTTLLGCTNRRTFSKVLFSVLSCSKCTRTLTVETADKMHELGSHTHTHTHSLSLSLSHTHTRTDARTRVCRAAISQLNQRASELHRRLHATRGHGRGTGQC